MKERRQLYSFYRQLAILLRAGFTLLRALNILSETGSSRQLSPVLRNVIGQIEGGSTFWGALEREPAYFPPLEVQLVRAGEESGRLPDVLKRLAAAGMRQIKLKNQIATIAAYPCVVVVAVVAVIILLSTIVLPNFLQFYNQYHIELPFAARVIMRISNLVTHHGVVLLLAVAVVVALLRMGIAQPKIRYAWDSLKLHYAPFGPLTKEYIVIGTCSTLGMLLESGINLIRALELTRDGASNRVVRRVLNDVREEVTAGHSIAGPLRAKPIFPALVVDMIISGVDAGNLPENLSHATEIYQEEFDNKLQLMQRMTEPVLVLFVGAIVMFVVFAFFFTYIRLITAMSSGH